MRLIIMAAPRPAPNWHSTLASALLGGFSGDTVVSVDGTVLQTEWQLYGHHGVRLSEWTGLGRPVERARQNMSRCLRMVDRFDTVIVEDDLTFARGWEATTNEAFAQMPPHSVLLGYCRDALPPGLHEREDPGDLWDSTLFVGWSDREDAMAAAEHLATSDLPADNALTEFWRQMKIRRFTISPSLVQHLGDQAIINPTHGRRRTPNWLP